MKRTMMMLLAAFVCLSSVNAQKKHNYDTMDLLVGGKVGIGASTLTSIDAKYQFFPTAGIYGELFINPSLSMSLELAYVHKGGNDTYAVKAPEYGPYDYHLHYINTSYLVKYYVTKELGIYTGLTLGRSVGAKSKFEGSTTDIKDEVKSGDFSIPVGLEYNIGKNLTLDARYHWSTGKIAKTDKAKYILGDAHNSLITLTIGYKFLVF